MSFMFGRLAFGTARLDFSKISINPTNGPCSYRPSFFQNAPGLYNITSNCVITKPYLQVICIWNIRVAGCSFCKCSQKLMSGANFHDFLLFRFINRHGSARGPTRTFSDKFSECSEAKLRRNLLYVWTAGFWNCTLGFVKNHNKPIKIAHIITGHHVCKTPPACIILLGEVLLLNRIYKSNVF